MEPSVRVQIPIATQVKIDGFGRLFSLCAISNKLNACSVGFERNVRIQNTEKKSWVHDFSFQYFVDVSRGRDFECFMNNKVMK